MVRRCPPATGISARTVPVASISPVNIASMRTSRPSGTVVGPPVQPGRHGPAYGIRAQRVIGDEFADAVDDAGRPAGGLQRRRRPRPATTGRPRATSAVSPPARVPSVASTSTPSPAAAPRQAAPVPPPGRHHHDRTRIEALHQSRRRRQRQSAGRTPRGSAADAGRPRGPSAADRRCAPWLPRWRSHRHGCAAVVSTAPPQDR